ncbi:HNH endonuclease [Massilia pinisoli]|uniref:HNH endonuclease n=1 Tax=Massilia pinisoli TaxID=1772194 RepID=A0ABT1ZM62_9BURK|nr:YDG/SRA domain-containing protein [Massilia pinisoli]MCS0581005.1 HNH endonuclease [Massilia pinisoli]
MAKVRFFGEIPHNPPGTVYQNRIQMNAAGVHMPTQAGISGTPREGADSVVISGGYKDDIDQGDVIIYTGHGGRDDRWRHIADQELTKGNLALVRSQLEGLPVRVIRGADRRNPYAPASGYRYDGLFRVESHWREVEEGGFQIWRFRLVRETASSISVPSVPETTGIERGNRIPSRTTVTTQRVIRDTALARELKQRYDHSCQICGLRISTPSGSYAEAAHIRPLGSPHNGPDTASNILCLCPNHHTMFDLGVFSINDDLSLVGLHGTLSILPGHAIDTAHLAYHRQHFYEELDRIVDQTIGLPVSDDRSR